MDFPPLAINGGPPVRQKRLPIFRLELGPEEQQAVQRVLAGGQISRGPLREELAAQLCAYTGSKHAVVVSSGTAALHLAVQALGLDPGSEIIVPSLSFVASAFAAEYAGATPVFAEIDPKTLNLSPEDTEARITPRTRAILPVHFAGQVTDFGRLADIARRHELRIVDDAAHALGARSGKTRVGCLADLTCFSFFATKNMTTGEGGAVTMDDAVLAQEIARLRAHGIVPLADAPQTSGYYDVAGIGYNYHLSDVNIAIGIEQLKKLDRQNQARRERARRLTDLLSDIDEIVLPEPAADHVFHLYTIQVRLDRVTAVRDELVRALLAEGIHVGRYYPPIHLFSYFRRKYGFRAGSLPVTERVCDSLITLPMYPSLAEEDLQTIRRSLQKVLFHFRKEP